MSADIEVRIREEGQKTIVLLSEGRPGLDLLVEKCDNPVVFPISTTKRVNLAFYQSNLRFIHGGFPAYPLLN